jgi:molybdenum cofactor synthesis domain-containing protein
MIPLDEARRRVLAACSPTPPTEVSIADAVNLVSAEAVTASEDVPGFANSAMDGFALRSVDVSGHGTELRVVASQMAGAGIPREVGRAEAVRIMTGAPLPHGADAVCPLEQARVIECGSAVLIERTIDAGLNVRLPGGDIAIGDTVVEAGAVMTPAHVGVLASLGVTTVRVVPTPLVGVLSVGDELQEGPASLAAGMIRDANRHALIAQLANDGFRTVDLGIVPDDAELLARVLRRATEQCDAVVSSAGISVGDLDVTRDVFDKLSAGFAEWMQVAIKPAKPFAFGRDVATGTPLFGLPGNPVAALVSYELLARPALRLMSGQRELDRPRITASATEAIARKRDGKLHLVRVVATYAKTGRVMVTPVMGQRSHMLSAMARSNALAFVPDGDGVAAGDDVLISVIGDLWCGE